MSRMAQFKRFLRIRLLLLIGLTPIKITHKVKKNDLLELGLNLQLLTHEAIHETIIIGTDASEDSDSQAR